VYGKAATHATVIIIDELEDRSSLSSGFPGQRLLVASTESTKSRVSKLLSACDVAVQHGHRARSRSPSSVDDMRGV